LAYRRTEAVAQRLAENRRRIINAARELVLEGGFASAQMAPVAERAGLATGTLYRYFSAKDELCLQVFREVSAREMSILNAIASKTAPAPTRLEQVVRTFATRAIRGRRLAYALLAEPVDNAIAEERWRFRRTHADIFTRVIQDGLEEGSFEVADARLAATCIAGAVPSALIGPLAPESHELDGNGDHVIDAIVQFCLQAVGYQGKMTGQGLAKDQRVTA
jgi:AcrR family transcriptional regulator